MKIRTVIGLIALLTLCAVIAHDLLKPVAKVAPAVITSINTPFEQITFDPPKVTFSENVFKELLLPDAAKLPPQTDAAKENELRVAAIEARLHQLRVAEFRGEMFEGAALAILETRQTLLKEILDSTDATHESLRPLLLPEQQAYADEAQKQFKAELEKIYHGQ